MLHKANALLRQARESHGWTQAELAERIECPSSVAISRWESGSVSPGLHYQGKLCQLFQKTPYELGFLLHEEPEDNQARLGLPLPRSIFLYKVPLPHPEELYGRMREKQRLVTRTFHKGSTSITGARRIGKTWLAHYARFIILDQFGSAFRFGYLDAMSARCRTVPGFTAEALRVLGLASTSAQHGLTALTDGLQTLQDQKLVPVLCIDEFESFSDNQEFTLNFFSGLRAMTQMQDLVLITISRDNLRSIVGQNARGSGFFNIFEEIRLKKFSSSETDQFIQTKGQAAGFTLQECDYLWQHGRENTREEAWVPQRLQFAGQTLLDDLPQVRLNPNYKSIFEEHVKAEFGE
jgi:transcriptional regulator with XRE-family HTH domain